MTGPTRRRRHACGTSRVVAAGASHNLIQMAEVRAHGGPTSRGYSPTEANEPIRTRIRTELGRREPCVSGP